MHSVLWCVNRVPDTGEVNVSSTVLSTIPKASLLVTPSLLLWVYIWMILITDALPEAVKLCCIIFKQVAGRQVTSTAKP